MGEQNGGPNDIAFESYGVCLSVSASAPELLDKIRHFLPPGWQPCSPSSVERRFSLTAEDGGTYALTQGGKPLAGGQRIGLDLALALLDSEIRIYLGRKSSDTIFIHAGCVGYEGAAIVIPAPSFGGKTTLVTALVRAGAVYYSDEFAVIDRDGRVQPYAKPLSVRGDGLAQTDHAVEDLGGVAGEEALPLGMIVIASYRPGAEWQPKRLSPGAGAMALLANAVPAQERPQEVMHAISRAAEGAVVIESDRGEANPIAPSLLAELERHTA